MPTSRRKPQAAALPWWLGGGEEECPHCGLLYAYEIEFRCPDCDSPSCLHCKQLHADGRVLCAECVAECADAEGRSRG